MYGLCPSMMSLPLWYEYDYHVIMDHARLISAGKENSKDYISFLLLHTHLKEFLWMANWSNSFEWVDHT